MLGRLYGFYLTYLFEGQSMGVRLEVFQFEKIHRFKCILGSDVRTG